MLEYVIICPICKKKYKLTPKDPTVLARKQFSCPNCRYNTSFSSLIEGLPLSSQPVTQTDISNINRNNAPVQHLATKVSQNVALQMKAYITVTSTGAKFVLNPGIYVLGRKSSDSLASLQLAPDISMSRQHARVAVQPVAGKMMAQIIGLKANNPIIINGKILAAGQPYTLKTGDKIQLGRTLVLFTI